eukprot:919735-Prorocentrum_minimum.AAC.1
MVERIVREAPLLNAHVQEGLGPVEAPFQPPPERVRVFGEGGPDYRRQHRHLGEHVDHARVVLVNARHLGIVVCRGSGGGREGVQGRFDGQV